MDSSGSSEWFGERKFLKCAVILGGGIALTGSLYAAYKMWNEANNDTKDEGFVDVAKIDDASEKKVLVLGLDSSGKSTLLSALSKNDNTLATQATEGFNVICVNTDKVPLNIWEIGGAKKMRKYWNNFIQDTSVLMFVVDSHEEERFPEAFDELHNILADERLTKVPILVVAAKQDGECPQSPSQVLYALGLESMPNKEQKVQVIATSVLPTSQSGIDELQAVLTKLCT